MGNFNDFTAYGYEVTRELGANRGAGRIAYLAREIDREIKILQQLKHPNIPRYLASFETPQSSCIVQEYIDGKPLSEIISK